CVEINTIGLSENELESLRFYPNPTDGIVYLDKNGLHSELSVKITDLTGKKYSERHFKCNDEVIIQLPEQSGVYFIEITDGDTLVIKEILTY
ncbi:MAG: T9SS type A sorting domain-containing protein, partial [Crocinitomicaceae bacterium]